MPKKQEDDKFYLGNKNLPRPDQEFEWTPKMVRDLKKCRQNILYFAENYFYIVNLDLAMGTSNSDGAEESLENWYQHTL